MMFKNMFATAAMAHAVSCANMTSSPAAGMTGAGSAAMRTSMFHIALILGAIQMASIIISVLLIMVNIFTIYSHQPPLPWMTA